MGGSVRRERSGSTPDVSSETGKPSNRPDLRERQVRRGGAVFLHRLGWQRHLRKNWRLPARRGLSSAGGRARL